MKGYIFKELQQLEINLKRKIKGYVEIEILSNLFYVHISSYINIKMIFEMEALSRDGIERIEEKIINDYKGAILNRFFH